MAAFNHSITSYHDRLNQVLEIAGITTKEEKVDCLVEVTGRDARTVQRWLSGEQKPSLASFESIEGVLEAFKMRPALNWLYTGKGYTPKEAIVIEAMTTMSEWEKDKFIRMLIRLMNNDRKVLRLLHLFNTGYINRERLMSSM